MKVILRVEPHPSGNYTLTEKLGDDTKRDCDGDLFTNQDRGDFYRAVALKISEHINQSNEVEYIDTAE